MVGLAFCAFSNNTWTHQWTANLIENYRAFQAELSVLKEAVNYAITQPSNRTIVIHVDNRASILASSNPKSTNHTARKIFHIFLSHPNIKITWIKAHAGHGGKEKADQLAEVAAEHEQS
ncbi:hypothetical protein AVEN_194858-1 [Araneus ventricosus]|uniref:RNase H type-1 domain-containing protein n=1 Tax=Araneus ventricosus TaxID=182803 RepID=A0A4Y2B562_ARAVE|nr:hypothetical protein AVEN_194858-1 [Araneus ventricosus]